MKTAPFLLAALLTFPALAHANDTSVSGIGGRWRIEGKEHPAIRMVSEKIDLTLTSPGKYTTVAEFVFQNSGPATSVQMGFPETGYGDIAPKDFKSKPSFTRFKTSVDGVPFKAQRRFTTAGEGSFDALWVKTVPFRAKQMRKVRVSYQSKWGSMSAFPGHFVTYDFTGGNWRGNVAQSVLTVHLNIPGTYLVSTDKFEKSQPQFKRQGQRFIYTWNNWQAQQAFAFRFDTTLCNWLGGGEVSGLPVNIGSPNEGEVGYLPRGVVRNGQTFVNLRSWLDWATEKKWVTSSYDSKARTLYIHEGKRSVPFSSTGQGYFTASSRGGVSNLFVPAAKLEREFGAKFETNLKTHQLAFSKSLLKVLTSH